MARIRLNFVTGTVEDNPLTDAATTLTSSGLTDLPTIADPDIAVIILDPDGTPEIVHVTAHTAAADTATILRGQEGTVALEHASTTPWRHGPTADDFSDVSISGDVLQVVVWDEGEEAYPDRPAEALVVRYIGPVEPLDWEAIDEWRVYGDPPPVDPDAVGTLAQWLKADAIGGLSGGDPVATWTASTGNNATQATSGNRPTYQTAVVNGHPVVRFDGTDDYLEFAGLGAALTEYTILAVVKPDTYSGERTVLSQDATGFSNDLLFGIDPEGANTVNDRWGASVQNTSTRTTVAGTTVPDTTNFEIVGLRYNGSLLELLRGSVVDNTASPAGYNVANRTWNIGRNPGANLRFFDGDIAEIAVYSTAIPDFDLGRVIDGLAVKYGLA